MTIRLTMAIAAGKAAGLASRVLGRGGGTTLPGVVARRLDPDTLRQLAVRLPEGVIVVGGTNGKTTTTRMLAAIIQAAGYTLLHNRAGANLLSGLTATALAGATLTGRLRAGIGLFETDEAALPDALDETRPRLVLLHNLFRDQLDRYGEVDTIASSWRAALEHLPPETVVLLNADDPAVAALGDGLRAQVCYYGLQDTRHAAGAAAHIADAQFCRRCGAPYSYSALFYAHVGHYACPRCGHTRPVPQFRLERIDLDGTTGSRLIVAFPAGAQGRAQDWQRDSAPSGYVEIRLPIPGLYNAFNALAAVSAALLLGITPDRARDTLEHFSAAFGRIERIDAAGKPLLLALIKNPIGASETVRMLTESQMGGIATRPQVSPSPLPHPTPPGLHLLIAINDNFADGTDVSWLWDADFEYLRGRVARAAVSGTRAADMAVRLKYAGVDSESTTVEPDLTRALDDALEQLPAGATLYVLPTYTAMLDLRAELVRRGWARPFWED